MILWFTKGILIDRIAIRNYTADQSRDDLHGITYEPES